MPPLVLDGTNGVSGVDGTASNPSLEGTDSNTGIFYPAADTWAVATGGTEALRVNSSQQVGIGETSPAAPLHIKSATNNIMRLQSSDATTGNLYFSFYNSSGTQKGYIGYGNSGDDALQIQNEANSYMTFATNGSERARITSGGYFKASNNGVYQSSTTSIHEFKTDSNDWTVWLNSTTTTGSNCYGLRASYPNAAPNGTGNWFLYCDDSGGQRASIRSNGGLANYSANNVNLSDRREKTNFAPAKNYLDVICAIPVQTFNYIDQSEDDPGETLGVVAQDVQAVAPEMVMESNWGSEEEPKMRLSIYQTDLQYALMKSIQELKAIVDAQAAEIATLKAQP